MKLAPAILALIALPTAPAQLLSKKALSWDVVKKIAAAAEERARKDNWNVAIAILDDGANLLYFQRMDGVQLGSIQVSMRKAESAIKFKRPGKAFADDLAARPQLLVLPGALPFEGGVPLTCKGEIVGAIGVSGVVSNQDAMIAQAAADALEKGFCR